MCDSSCSFVFEDPIWSFYLSDLVPSHIKASHSHFSLSLVPVGNSEKERVEDLDVRTLTKSLWSYVFGKRALFVNPQYAAFEKPIWPACGAASIQVRFL